VESEDPLAQAATSDHKTRFSARQSEAEDKKDQAKLVKAESKVSKRPEAATSTQTADEKVQASPLGQIAPPEKKPKKTKRKKGEVKERLQDKPMPVQTTPEVAPTVNSALGAPAAAGTRANGSNSTSDRTTLPSVNAPTSGTLPQGTANPSTGGQPNPATPPNPTVPQPQ
jgi:peptidyl-prolyl cis-trans isomerase SurA